MIVRCEKGHYYDNSKFTSCPHCTGSTLMGVTSMDQQTVSVTAPVSGGFLQDDERTIAKCPGDADGHTEAFHGGDDEKTMGIFQSIRSGAPVVGWLVCTKGPERGRDYRLHAGRNFVGRSWKMDVCIVEDRSISRENHASIVFDPKACIFSLVPGDSVDTCLNGEPLTSPHPLLAGDRISLGQSEFDFVPYCNGEVIWE
ncbi:MAG: FHA domain-containing protein [Clostridia bacterium]|nr:FHA domain-containing protein [Clostridia bacterium]